VTAVDRKRLTREYKATPRPMGIYCVHNRAMRKSLVGSSTDLPSMLNRIRFQLENGLYPDKALQADWNSLGPTDFSFAALDHLKPKDEPAYDPREDLSVLREI
jgi:hypothetical protein